MEPQQRDYWPTQEWRKAAPGETGIQTALLDSMQSSIANHIPGLHALLIVRNGYLVFEEYYQGFHHQSYHSISSATKAYTSALLGVLLAQGKIQSLDQPMLDFFPEFAATEADPRKKAVTLRHLLSLTGGFSKQFPHEYWLNPVQLAIERPMEQEPGQAFYYDSQGVDILAGIITRVAGMNAAAFADQTLFKELGIWRDEKARFTWKNDPQGAHEWHGDAYWDEEHGYLWKVDPQGHNTGAFGAHFTAQEMAKFGYLYLNQGYWAGKQLIPADYVAESTRQQSAGGPPVNDAYGYLWWIIQHGEYTAFFASGFGGKMIYVIPNRDLVVVTLASTEQARRDPQQWDKIKALVPDFIIPAAQ